MPAILPDEVFYSSAKARLCLMRLGRNPDGEGKPFLLKMIQTFHKELCEDLIDWLNTLDRPTADALVMRAYVLINEEEATMLLGRDLDTVGDLVIGFLLSALYAQAEDRARLFGGFLRFSDKVLAVLSDR